MYIVSQEKFCMARKCHLTGEGVRRLSCIERNAMSGDARKLVFGGSYQVQHKPTCTATENGWRLEIWDLDSRGIVLSMLRKQRR